MRRAARDAELDDRIPRRSYLVGQALPTLEIDTRELLAICRHALFEVMDPVMMHERCASIDGSYVLGGHCVRVLDRGHLGVARV